MSALLNDSLAPLTPNQTGVVEAPRLTITAPAPSPQGSSAALGVQVDRTERRVTVRGELDIASVPVLADAMVRLSDVNPGDCTIDITGLTFIDAAGIGCLVRFTNQLEASGSKMHVLGASPRLRRVFEIAQLGGLLPAA